MVAPKLRSFGSSTARILKGRSGVCETHSRRLPLSNLKRHPAKVTGAMQARSSSRHPLIVESKIVLPGTPVLR